MSFKIGQTVVMRNKNSELDGSLGTVVEVPYWSKHEIEDDRIWVEWYGEAIKHYLSNGNTTCYTKVDIVRPYTKLDKALK